MENVYVILAVHTRRYGARVFSERRPVAVADCMETAKKILSEKKYSDPNVKYITQKWNVIDSTYGMASL